MKALIVLFAVYACASAQTVRVYRPQSPQIRGGAEANAAVLRQSYELSPEGAYEWSYETENGISAQERGRGGDPTGTQAQGSFQYTSPEGIPIAVQYTADENGFQPQGEHLPTPPPIPEAILRSIEWNAAHPDGAQRRQFIQ
ncbi:hypothetical protein Trydic_g22308 [Trypoxylus dichotomus]